MSITTKLSDNLRNTLLQAKKISLAQKSKHVTLNHFLISLFIIQKDNLAFEDKVSEKTLDTKIVRTFLEYSIPKGASNAAGVKDFQNLLIKASILAKKYHHYFVGTEHCWAIIMEKQSPLIKHVFETLKINQSALKSQTNAILRGNSRFPDLTKFFQKNNSTPFGGDDFMNSKNVLEYFSVDLTNKRVQQDINPIINRDQEIERLIQILCRKDKNNPVILGEPGVGKTALVEGLAKKILNEEVPNILINKKILSLDLGLIVAGTMYRGDFENRLKAILDEVKNNPDIILFIDELHNVIGAGSSSGSLDAANLLKPLLARGQLRCIGATTHDEFKKFIEKDPALERRFQPIILTEPSVEETLEILNGVKDNYQKYHRVTFTDEALKVAVLMSHKYITDKLLPDKAIDLIDEAAAKKRIQNSNLPIFREIQKLDTELQKIKSLKSQAVLDENFSQAIKYKQDEKRLNEKITYLKNTATPQDSSAIVDKNEILAILAQKIKMPVADLETSEVTKIQTASADLKTQLIGQAQAIDDVSQLLIRAKLGLNDEQRPLASMMFVGPSGVGKTYLAKLLAQHLYPKRESFLRLDMSEYGEKFTVSKLIGAPAGYVGYRETSLLTDFVKRQPYSLILFDEIEKAHPDVLNLLLQILEDGTLTDALGKKINFKNTIIILASNLGFDSNNKKSTVGFQNSADKNIWPDKLLAEAKKIFRQELLNRLDATITFNNLQSSDLNAIIDLHLKSLTEKLNAKGVKLIITKKTREKIFKLAQTRDDNARACRQIIREEIENKIAPALIKNKNKTIRL